MKEAAIAKSKADTAISNAEREQREAVKQQRVYKRLSENQEKEIKKEAERRIETYKRSISQEYKKKEQKLREQLKRKAIWYNFALAEMGIYGLVMTILYLS